MRFLKNPSSLALLCSGIYDKVGPRGGNTGQQADSTKGNPLPPTDRPGEPGA